MQSPNGPQRPGRLEEILARAESREPEPEKPPSIWVQTRATIRRRIITGVLFLIPIATTIWFVNFFLRWIYASFEPLLRPILQGWGMRPDSAAFRAVGIVMSVLAVLILLYLVGLITGRAAVRRLIDLGERLLVRIPFVKFFYKTTKQIVDAIALPSKGSIKKVVLIDFFRPGMKTIAFVTGETPVEGMPEPYVNLFVPTTPNPTSGYLVMLPRDQVYETGLSMEEAMTFIVSGGILPPGRLRTLPYQPTFPPAPEKPKEIGQAEPEAT